VHDESVLPAVEEPECGVEHETLTDAELADLSGVLVDDLHLHIKFVAIVFVVVLHYFVPVHDLKAKLVRDGGLNVVCLF